MFLVLFLSFPVVVLVALLALEARLHRNRSLAGSAGMPAAFDRPEFAGRLGGRVR
ncbi:hypothetical protein ACI79J_01475 [Geodermatophilus sp. SYSU D01062]